MKVYLNGTIDRLKAYLVAKGYTQIYGFDYSGTLSRSKNFFMVLIIRLFISFAATFHWPLHQLDGKNDFLHADI